MRSSESGPAMRVTTPRRDPTSQRVVARVPPVRVARPLAESPACHRVGGGYPGGEELRGSAGQAGCQLYTLLASDATAEGGQDGGDDVRERHGVVGVQL